MPPLDKKLIKLNKYLSLCGIASRRKSDDIILSGKIKVNGEVIKELGKSISFKDEVLYEGKKIKPENYTYIKYYKPAGFITSLKDEKGRKTIYDILPPEVKNLKTAGRLDKDSSGLLIMTNDGDLINELAHPNGNVSKVYKVTVQGRVSNNDLYRLEKGIEIEKNKIAYAYARIIEYKQKNTILEVILYQGLNRQIRKMFETLEHPVIALKRIQHGIISIEGLKKGQFKYINPRQIKELRSYLANQKKTKNK